MENKRALYTREWETVKRESKSRMREYLDPKGSTRRGRRR